MPQISVVVPVYKVEPYIHRCVGSILSQTFTDFELILVDDGSPDSCPAICDEYAQRDSRIHVIHQPNGGLSAARNAGIDWAFAHSDSQWLTFVDSDDWVHPEMLDRLYRAAIETDAQVSVCGYAETHGEEPEPDLNQAQPEIWKPEVFYVKRGVNSVVAWGKLYRKESFATLRYPVGRVHEDEYITYLALCQANRVVYLPPAMYYYYFNLQGITKASFSLKLLDSLPALKEQYAFFSKNYSDDLSRVIALKYIRHLCKYIKLTKEHSVCRHDEYHMHSIRLKKELKQFIKENPEFRSELSREENIPAYKSTFPFLSFFPLLKPRMQYLVTIGVQGVVNRLRHKISWLFQKKQK